MNTAGDPSDTFRQEAQELLEQLEQTLLDLDRRPGDGDLIDGAFRALHTIKGSGAMFGFERVAAFTHHVESAFDLVRKGKLSSSRELIGLTLAAKDHMRALIETPDSAAETAGEAILQALEALLGNAPGAAPPGAPPLDHWHVRFRLPRDAMATGTDPLLLLDELRSLGTATVTAEIDDVPYLEELDPAECRVGWDVRLATDQPHAAIEQVFLFVLDDMELLIERVAPTGSATAAEAAVAAIDGEDATAPAAAAAPESAAEPASGGRPGPSGESRRARDGNSIRVPTERLDELMDRVGELVIAQSRLKLLAAASDDGQVKSIAEDIERLARELQDTCMGVRMVPIGSLFGRFRRLIHDLSRDLGKEIELFTDGEETELDKTVIERLNDPIVHLIRNASDHGLEAAAARAAAGKPAKGRISLTARHAGAEVLITVADDGRGLDRARIQARAEENGLLPAGAKLADAELFQVLFHPGFSTAAQVTNLSGRGVGMDVVKRTIEGLRGTIDVTSRAGTGTTVTLRLPLTLAIIDGLLVRVGRGRYVIPLTAVEECVELSPAEDARSTGRNFLNIRGDLVPFLRLREMFRSGEPADRYQKVVIVSSGDQRVGLVVDQVIGDHQTVIKSLSSLHADVKNFSGATILGDGGVALILDVAYLVDSGQVRDERLKAAG